MEICIHIRVSILGTDKFHCGTDKCMILNYIFAQMQISDFLKKLIDKQKVQTKYETIDLFF